MEGAIFLAGNVNGSVDLGGGELVSAGGDDVLVASFDAAGDYRWAKLSGDGDDQDALGLSVDPAGHVIVIGEFKSTVDFGCGPLVSAGGSDAFVVELVR
jgi:hypothetical protein